MTLYSVSICLPDGGILLVLKGKGGYLAQQMRTIMSLSYVTLVNCSWPGIFSHILVDPRQKVTKMACFNKAKQFELVISN